MRWWVLLLGLVLAGGAAFLAFRSPAVAPTVNGTVNGTVNTNVATVTTFDSCAGAGYPIAESYPRRCTVPGGATFTEDIGNALAMQESIVVDSPRPNAAVSSPLAVTGNAVGGWYSEGVFPVELLDASGERIASGQAHATGDWMTPEFVPFTVSLTWDAGGSGSATLVLHRDNPSGLPANDAALRVPLRL